MSYSNEPALMSSFIISSVSLNGSNRTGNTITISEDAAYAAVDAALALGADVETTACRRVRRRYSYEVLVRYCRRFYGMSSRAVFLNQLLPLTR